MALIARENRQVMPMGRCSNSHICKPRGMTTAGRREAGHFGRRASVGALSRWVTEKTRRRPATPAGWSQAKRVAGVSQALWLNEANREHQDDQSDALFVIAVCIFVLTTLRNSNKKAHSRLLRAEHDSGARSAAWVRSALARGAGAVPSPPRRLRGANWSNEAKHGFGETKPCRRNGQTGQTKPMHQDVKVRDDIVAAVPLSRCPGPPGRISDRQPARALVVRLGGGLGRTKPTEDFGQTKPMQECEGAQRHDDPATCSALLTRS
jgi:hypothetical protein